MNDIKIKIENLTKIFGPKPKAVLDYVYNGIGKDELLKKYGHVLGLHDINLSLRNRNIEVIMGLSGSGKSTLIRHINRLIEPTAGAIEVDGEDVLQMNEKQLRHFRQSKTAMVFQKFALMPHHTVIENAGFGLKMQGKDKSFIREHAHKWLHRVGLKGYENHYPAQLSGGMQQRVGLARALACDADILMMDEAFSALDPLIRSDMQDLLLELQEELHKTIVFITHDLDEALKIGDRIAILNNGELVQHGTPQDILLSPADDYVERFVADVNRTRVLLAKSIMVDDKPDDLSQSVTCKEDETVDTVLHALLSEDGSYVIVEDERGKKVGYIDKETLAMVFQAEHRSAA
ncbi:MAG: betaine/proline/choline family ABC transporter ATP-binding protein [Sedimenticola sp.]